MNYWCIIICALLFLLKTATLFATVISIPSYHHLFIIIITITIGHSIIILNCSQHHCNIMQLMTISGCGEKRLNAESSEEKKKYLNCPPGLKCSGDTSKKIETKSFFDVSVWMCVGNKRGPQDSIRLLIVTNARVLLYHPYKQSLCQAHYRATNDFIS